MYLMNKGFHPANFVFARRVSGRLRAGKTVLALDVAGSKEDVYRVRITNGALWPRQYSQAALSEPADLLCGGQGQQSRLSVSSGAELKLTARDGTVALRTRPGASFGICGRQWLFEFEQPAAAQFYGMGEKSTPFEKSGRCHKFWNTDAFADFPGEQVINGEYDPDYITVPWVIVKQGNSYAGLLMDNPFASLVSIGERGRRNGSFYLGAEDGPVVLYIIYGPTLRELTCKFQRLTGLAPLPPAWAFGYHQSRWGYQSRKDLEELADAFEKHEYPASGLWLDIEYMRGYRVFTFEKKHFPSPARDLAAISRRGYRVVPIIDPGVKQEPGYGVYESGKKAGIYCRNAAGNDFVGMVWPGLTVFPDFTKKKGRAWWAELVKEFARQGAGGAWLDMNDPSTGFVECLGMLFEDGKTAHEAYHNQYASLMAMASRHGFLAARPNERPFLISRSGYTGDQKYSGHWTGDNASNYRHLQRAIGRTLNLALSGMALNAPDIGGFAGDTSARLLTDWMKACYLFPLCRNHTSMGTTRQEPWAFDRATLETMRAFTRARYKLIPYLYNLFAAHEQTGEAVLRPLFYDFADTPRLNLGAIADQMMVGPWIMQAPFVAEKQAHRTVLLPPGRWFGLHTGRWERGNRAVRAANNRRSTPAYVREGALVPMQAGIARTNRIDLSHIELLCALPAGYRGTARTGYVCDDGLSFDYRAGKRTRLAIAARRSGDKLTVTVQTERDGFGEVEISPVTLDAVRAVTMVRDGVRRELRPSRSALTLAGAPVAARLWK